MKTLILPYDKTSKTALKLRSALDAQFLKKVNSKYTYKDGDRIINWGCTQYPYNIWDKPIINHPLRVNRAVDKKDSLLVMQYGNVPTVEFITYPTIAIQVLKKGNILYAHKDPKGHEGSGITIIKGKKDFVVAPLYTVYYEHTRQYRVHIVNNKIIYTTITKKVEPLADNYIKNEKTGWLHVHHGFHTPERVKKVAKQAINSLDLDFGCVDVLHNHYKKQAVVCEVNTAPGLGPTLLNAYVEAFNNEY